MNLITIDPGVKKCGYAYFEKGVLITADWILTNHAVGNAAVGVYPPGMAARAVCEAPRFYGSLSDRSKNKNSIDPNDLLDLAMVVGRFVQVGADIVYPADWKAQVPKQVMTARILTFLSAEEKANMRSTDHNTIDAIGIGLWKLGRMGRGGAKP